ncbi:uncharacterized protein LOC112692242 isoform X2 [Sipha flava]|nr:uncharacterized protein LOC112692242 isoform X2 [Sipha flava]XP_025422637.1 uncharacterized protein LOC112692242 isoform X2 [Sipha flava]
MRSHFKKIYDVKPIVKCWSDACPNKRLLKNTINIRDFQVLPHYCNSTISSTAKKSVKQKYDNNKLTRPSSSKKKHINRNLSYESAYNDVDFDSVENNSRTNSPEDHHSNREDESKTINRHDRTIKSIHPKKSSKKKDHFFQNTTNDSYQRFLEEMTNEVVRLDLCTDKALQNVFRKHIKHNIGKLDEKKMMVEVKKVQVLLDLPSDNEDRFTGFDEIATLPTNDETVKCNFSTSKSGK